MRTVLWQLTVTSLIALAGTPLTTACPPKGIPPLDAETARRALIELIRAKPLAFSSPGRTETVEELQKAPIQRESDGSFWVGNFLIYPQHRTYSLDHFYGNPEKGFFEHWNWYGSFNLAAGKTWVAAEPRFQRAWRR